MEGLGTSYIEARIGVVDPGRGVRFSILICFIIVDGGQTDGLIGDRAGRHGRTKPIRVSRLALGLNEYIRALADLEDGD